jgi:hypothetical protein
MIKRLLSLLGLVLLFGLLMSKILTASVFFGNNANATISAPATACLRKPRLSTAERWSRSYLIVSPVATGWPSLGVLRSVGVRLQVEVVHRDLFLFRQLCDPSRTFVIGREAIYARRSDDLLPHVIYHKTIVHTLPGKTLQRKSGHCQFPERDFLL